MIDRTGVIGGFIGYLALLIPQPEIPPCGCGQNVGSRIVCDANALPVACHSGLGDRGRNSICRRGDDNRTHGDSRRSRILDHPAAERNVHLVRHSVGP